MKIWKWSSLTCFILLLCHCTEVAPPLPVVLAVPQNDPLPPVYTPTPAPPGQLVVHSNPPRAWLKLDQVALSTPTPWKGELSSGWHSIEVALPGYRTWTTQIEIIPSSPLTLSVKLQPRFQVTLLEPNSHIHWLKFVEWAPGGQTLRYAFGSESEEPQDWNWYRYQPTTAATEILARPDSHISATVRDEMGFCPLNLTSDKALCRRCYPLYESPSGTQIVYGLPKWSNGGSEPQCKGFFLWYADIDGRNAIFLGEVTANGAGKKPRLVWGANEDWLFIDITDHPRQAYLAHVTTGLFEHFPVMVEVSFYLPGIVPRFSPDGKKIAFVGTSWSTDGRQHAVWVTDLKNGLDTAVKVSNQVGLLQWSADSRYLYILDVARTHTLYRVDLANKAYENTILAADLPWPEANGYTDYSTGLLLPDMYEWALSPDETKLVYRGVDGTNLLWGILEIAASQ